MTITTDLGAFQSMSADSRVWIFQAERALSQQEEDYLRTSLKTFTSQWTSHNRALKANADVFYGCIMIIALDEDASSGASGCSIDKLTHQIQSLSRELNLDLMNRTTFYFFKEEKLYGINMHNLSEAIKNGSIDEDALVLDSMIKTTGQIRNELFKPLKDSWHSRFM